VSRNAEAALAVPPCDDPIFAKIERRRATCAEHLAASHELSAAEDRLPEEFHAQPSVAIPANLTADDIPLGVDDLVQAGKMMRCYTPQAIRDTVATNYRPELHADLIAKAIKDLRRERPRFGRARKRAGLPRANERAMPTQRGSCSPQGQRRSLE
jgi:hypothetical protein